MMGRRAPHFNVPNGGRQSPEKSTQPAAAGTKGVPLNKFRPPNIGTEQPFL